MFAFRWLGLLALVSVTACGSRRTVVVTPKPARLVEIEVEVYDPVSNGVWEGVSVRVVEGYHEWSNCTCEAGNPFWLVTDETGRVLFTAEDLADADIGFREDSSRRAILESDRDLDEAFVLIEIDAVGFDRVFVDVPVSWVQPSVLVSVPFSASGSGGIAAAPGTAGVRLIPPTAEQAPRAGLAISARAPAATVQ
jgi:hypothetical protein